MKRNVHSCPVYETVNQEGYEKKLRAGDDRILAEICQRCPHCSQSEKSSSLRRIGRAATARKLVIIEDN